MIFELSIILVSLLLILIIGYNALVQYRQKRDYEQQQQLQHHLGILRKMEQLLNAQHTLPISHTLLHSIYRKMTHSLELLCQEHTPQQAEHQKQYNELNQQMKVIAQQSNETVISPLNLPQHAKEMGALLQQTKQLKHLISNTQPSREIPIESLQKESKRLERLQLTLRIESSIKQAYEAAQAQQQGTATQILKNAQQALEGNLSQEALQLHHRVMTKLAELLDQQKIRQSSSLNVEHPHDKKDRNNADLLFQPKQKW